MTPFRAALLAVPALERDAWVDRVLGLGPPPDDGPELPRGGVAYLPCAVDALLEAVDRAGIGPDDVFVDVGAGVGRALAIVHRLTGAAAIGVEIQAALVEAARDLARRVSPTITIVHGDAAAALPIGSVYFLYCPFSDARLDQVLDHLEVIATTRSIRVCCVDVPLPERPWLAPDPPCGSVRVFRCTVRG